MSQDKPLNILWISFEDTTPRFGCYGDDVAQTPNVDRLASEGCVYTHCFSTAGVCAPARSAIITGMYPTFIGTHHMRTAHTNKNTPEMPTPYSAVIPHYVKCFSEYLRAAGYYCTNNGKCDYQFDRPVPFTAWDVWKITIPDLLANHWRNRPDPDQPFFAVYNLQSTHESGQWAEKGGDPKTDPDTVKLPPYLPDTLECRKALAGQYDNIAYNDTLVGQLLDQLEEDGLADNTAVFIWSDHGEGLPRSKRWPYDGGIRVPLIVKWPGKIKAGSRSNHLISTIDLAPTVLSMTGIDIPQHLQGHAFLGPKEEEPRQYIFATRDRYDESYDMIRAVRDKRFKYIRNYRPELERSLWIPYRNRHPIFQELWKMNREGKLKENPELAVLFEGSRRAEELYDTQKDPYELNNLVDNPHYAQDLERLRVVLDNWRHHYDRWGETDEVEMVRRWYPDGFQPRTVTPIFIPFDEDNPGRDAAYGQVELKAPALVQLHSPSQGASIGWTDEEGDEPEWKLYTDLLRFEKAGTWTIRAKAIRIGYQESAERAVTFIVG
ncbi:MAG: sulfatase [Candidatus Sumerlaeia bacterium]